MVFYLLHLEPIFKPNIINDYTLAYHCWPTICCNSCWYVCFKTLQNSKENSAKILNSSRTFMDFPHLGWVRCPPWSPYVLFHWAAGKSLGLHLGHRPPAHRCHRIPPKPGVSVHEMEIDPQPLTTIGKSWKVYGKVWENEVWNREILRQLVRPVFRQIHVAMGRTDRKGSELTWRNQIHQKKLGWIDWIVIHLTTKLRYRKKVGFPWVWKFDRQALRWKEVYHAKQPPRKPCRCLNLVACNECRSSSGVPMIHRWCHRWCHCDVPCSILLLTK